MKPSSPLRLTACRPFRLLPGFLRGPALWVALLATLALPRASAAVITNYSAAADLYTGSDGKVVSLSNRLLVGSNDTSYLTFALTGLDYASVTNATFRIYLVNSAANTQFNTTVTLNIMSPSAAFSMSDAGTSPAAGALYTPSLVSGQTTSTVVNGSLGSQYFDFDVTSLVTAANTSSDVIGFALTAPSGAIFRFTDRDPSNDGSPANTGLAPMLVLTTVPEPATNALLILGAAFLVLRRPKTKAVNA